MGKEQAYASPRCRKFPQSQPEGAKTACKARLSSPAFPPNQRRFKLYLMISKYDESPPKAAPFDKVYLYQIITLHSLNVILSINLNKDGETK